MGQHPGKVGQHARNLHSATDYYPGGMQMTGRKYLAPNASKPRYGFNGKENDNEVKGEGNLQDYGMRIYDPRLVRFLSEDPLQKQFPFYTPYQFSGNNPIKFIDLDGKEPVSPPKELENIGLIHDLDKGNIVSGFFNPNDRKHYMDVKKVNDPARKQSYFISEITGSHVYWKTEENTLRVHRKADGSVTANGSWEVYESYDQRQARFGGEIADGFGIGMFGIAAGVAAAPFVSALGGAPLIGSGAVSAPSWGAVGRGAAGAIGDAAGQLATNGGSFKALNWYSIGANLGGGIIGLNSFTTEAAASMLGRDGTLNSTSNIVTNTIIGGSLGGLIGSKNAPWSAENFSRIFDKKVANATSTIPEFWSSSIENSVPQQKEEEK